MAEVLRKFALDVVRLVLMHALAGTPALVVLRMRSS